MGRDLTPPRPPLYTPLNISKVFFCSILSLLQYCLNGQYYKTDFEMIVYVL